MGERNPLAVVLSVLFKAVKCVVMALAWCVIVMCVITKNR